MNYGWKIETGKRLVREGRIEGSDERDALRKVMSAEGAGLAAGECYRVKVGELVTSAYGDEFERVVESTGEGAVEPPAVGGYVYGGEPVFSSGVSAGAILPRELFMPPEEMIFVQPDFDRLSGPVAPENLWHNPKSSPLSDIQEAARRIFASGGPVASETWLADFVETQAERLELRGGHFELRDGSDRVFRLG